MCLASCSSSVSPSQGSLRAPCPPRRGPDRPRLLHLLLGLDVSWGLGAGAECVGLGVVESVPGTKVWGMELGVGSGAGALWSLGPGAGSWSWVLDLGPEAGSDRKSTRLNSSH